jgi:hypothetical protein
MNNLFGGQNHPGMDQLRQAFAPAQQAIQSAWAPYKAQLGGMGGQMGQGQGMQPPTGLAGGNPLSMLMGGQMPQMGQQSMHATQMPQQATLGGQNNSLQQLMQFGGRRSSFGGY